MLSKEEAIVLALSNRINDLMSDGKAFGIPEARAPTIELVNDSRALVRIVQLETELVDEPFAVQLALIQVAQCCPLRMIVGRKLIFGKQMAQICLIQIGDSDAVGSQLTFAPAKLN